MIKRNGVKWSVFLGVFFGFLLSANLVFAENFAKTKELFRGILGIVDLLTIIAAAAALLYFFWGLAKFILKAGDEDARKEGKKIMMWGIIALFVIVSIWGIVEFLQDDLLPGADFSTPIIFPNQQPSIGPIGLPLR